MPYEGRHELLHAVRRADGGLVRICARVCANASHVECTAAASRGRSRGFDRLTNTIDGQRSQRPAGLLHHAGVRLVLLEHRDEPLYATRAGDGHLIVACKPHARNCQLELQRIACSAGRRYRAGQCSTAQRTPARLRLGRACPGRPRCARFRRSVRSPAGSPLRARAWQPCGL